MLDTPSLCAVSSRADRGEDACLSLPASVCLHRTTGECSAFTDQGILAEEWGFTPSLIKSQQGHPGALLDSSDRQTPRASD
ncbi:hypothetical protein ACOMHN_013501 [Nucella lapillus]